MLDTSARLLRLLSLLQGRRSWTGATLAERLEITERTLRRDIERLRSLGYPIDSTSGTAGGYRLGAGADLPPLLLDDDEAVAVAVGLRSTVGSTVSGFEEASLRALTKLEQVMPSRLRKRVNALHSSIVPLSSGGPKVAADLLSSIASACRDLVHLRFAYRSYAGAENDRHVEPHRLVSSARCWYLLAWDVERSDWRTFRVDRMGAGLTTGARFSPRPLPDKDVAAYVSRGISSGAYPHTARVKLFAPLSALAERISPTAGVLESFDERSCVLTTGSHSLDSMAIWFVLLDVEFEVIEPPELSLHLRRLAERLGRSLDATPRPSMSSTPSSHSPADALDAATAGVQART